MRELYSSKTCTSNEDGEEEVEFVYCNGFLRSLFNLDKVVKTYVKRGDVWYDKLSGSKCSVSRTMTILIYTTIDSHARFEQEYSALCEVEQRVQTQCVVRSG